MLAGCIIGISLLLIFFGVVLSKSIQHPGQKKDKTWHKAFLRDIVDILVPVSIIVVATVWFGWSGTRAALENDDELYVVDSAAQSISIIYKDDYCVLEPNNLNYLIQYQDGDFQKVVSVPIDKTEIQFNDEMEPCIIQIKAKSHSLGYLFFHFPSQSTTRYKIVIPSDTLNTDFTYVVNPDKLHLKYK